MSRRGCVTLCECLTSITRLSTHQRIRFSRPLTTPNQSRIRCVSQGVHSSRSLALPLTLSPPPPATQKLYIVHKKKKTFLWHFHLIRSAKHLKITGCVYLLPYLLLMSSNQDVTKGGLLDYGQVVYAYAEWGIKE